ncbi:ABC transporter substrate-binding protein [Methyloversatilis thermotolerans]|uniref:ABC transporter substrate-binding protein n=1 Tax=Methyloversatilis thermotolerans TaxID=1346290 RepID=UPI001E5156DF|nr:ABC transporter substrate binding protein [Methyloversatilis thermotolerans]
MVIAAGAGALRVLGQTDVSVPVLGVLVPQAAFESIAADPSRRWSAIYIDQPFSRQLALIRMALPAARRVGVVVDAAAVDKLQPLRSAVSATPLQLSVGTFSGEPALFPVLAQVLEKADVFLALPDPQIHNAGTVRNLLLTSFRARVPVVGFSSAYARAGAVMSLYSSPDQIARQTADAVTQWMRDRSWPHPQHPRHFTVSVNAHVARSLGLKMDDGDLLRDRLIRQEQMP